MFGIGVSKYTFAVEAKIYGEVIAWLASYDVPYEGSIEYSIPGAKFHMITVTMVSNERLIMRDIDLALENIRSIKRWEESKKG